MIPGIDLRRMFIVIAMVGAVIGTSIAALVLLVWPWLWAIAKPALHAFTA